MTEIEANRMFVEIAVCALAEADYKAAKELIRTLDTGALRRLHARANELAILAENAYLEISRRQRIEKQMEKRWQEPQAKTTSKPRP
ncbi:MAG: hypothetical protein J2P41_15960 [Blastocatellia bacterium]|nr:hypothetical protein [Blastocatellia bacterium]